MCELTQRRARFACLLYSPVHLLYPARAWGQRIAPVLLLGLPEDQGQAGSEFAQDKVDENDY